MAELPSGTVTFLLTDVEGSTALWEEAPEAMRTALARHDELFEEAVRSHVGTHIRPRGEGDSRFAVFAAATDAVAGALAIQRAFAAETWPTQRPIKVRIGVHTGEAELRDGDYYGSAVNRCARLRGLAHGGQVLLSEATTSLVRDDLPGAASLVDLGDHCLRDLSRPERVHQLVAPGLPADFPRLPSLDTRLNNLPVQPTQLLGRDREVQAVRSLLLRDEVRLVTLTGPGGTGKTRLGLEVAADLLEHCPDGVFWVPLAPISDPDLMLSTIAHPLGLRAIGGRSLQDTVTGYLKEKRLLLLLDNFEQILPGAPLVADLLAACPKLKVLVTSRSALRLRGEREVAVSPLAYPARQRPTTVEATSQYAAVALFVRRAADVREGFALDAESATAVAEICRRVDGLPLGIELAAARVRVLTPQALLSRLERRLPLLTDGPRDLPERQRTLRDTIAWSYDLLDEAERRLIRRLSVFDGGWTLAAAEAVGGADGAREISVLDELGSLVAQSLVRRQGGAHDEPRFEMLETIREYAREQLDAGGEASTIHRRHFRYFLSLADAAQVEMRGLQQGAWLSRLEADHANVRAALQWASSHDVPSGLQLGVALWWFWWVRGHASEGRHWLESLLSAISVDAAASAESGSCHGGLSLVLARARQGAGLLTRTLGDYDRAAALLEQSFADFRALGDDGGAAVCLGHLAWMAGDQGDRPRATTLLERGSVLAHADGVDEHDRAFALQWLGAAARDVGDNERAMALFEESLALSRRLGDRWSIAQNLQWLGSVAWRRGDHRRAMELLTESLTQQRALGDRPGVAWSLHLLGRVLFDQGHAERASRLHQKSLVLYRDTGEQAGIPAALRGLGRVAHARGDPWSAARLFGAARAHEASSAPASSPSMAGEDDDLSDLRNSLGHEAFEAAWAEGRAMSLDQAIAYALEEQPSV